ncbi:MFS general substrate transporter [Aspergillus steynii IBT 23096]|uniref:MFS general substrate transporter n=1 Tax=Aspergillus steynii IBT 23096 TaxID=1392250 RepID=A0A2I2GL40_9EURO|nr:MFS general substrate transporter [Aspergillus steynii IBT 23096]PLB53598.1 MFS general substrate transporter [Aspergillus steynii IBT 23096]
MATETQSQAPGFVLQARGSLQGESDPRVEEEAPTPEPTPYLKIFSAGFSFFVAGVNDGSLGSVIPHLMRSYEIDTNMVSILYACTFFGWFVAAFSNSSVTQYLDLGAILSVGALLQILAQVLRTWLPPLPLYAVTFFLASLGQAYNDTHANIFVSTLPATHRSLGFIHAMYMAGCLVGPLIATAVASANAPSRWNLFYAFPLGIGVANLALVALAFRHHFAWIPRLRPSGRSSNEGRGKAAWKEIRATLSTPGVWLLSLFFFFFLGATITAGGWMVEYLVTVRDADSNIGYVLTGFYGGAFLGRLALAEPTYRWGERRMIFIYAVLCVGLQLVFWLVPDIAGAAVAVSFLGFLSGPFFATGINVGSRIFHPEIRSSAIAFVFVLGQIGGSIFPAITGIIAAREGVQVLQPMLVGLLGAAGLSWLVLPRDIALHCD